MTACAKPLMSSGDSQTVPQRDLWVLFLEDGGASRVCSKRGDHEWNVLSCKAFFSVKCP